MIMRQLNSPHIMHLYEVYETSNSLYMGLEMLEGGQLYEHLKKKVIFQNKEIQIIIFGILLGNRGKDGEHTIQIYPPSQGSSKCTKKESCTAT